MGLDQAQALYDLVRSDEQLTRALFRQALQDPQGTLDQLLAIAAAQGLEVSREDITTYLNTSADDATRQWLIKARGGL
ncbi:MAG: Nif11 family protein [Synechococcus sp. MED-G71]|jgi:plasmid stability protein|nr:MAG: Nif11 family protein [Synechococcus sp. MED-G71]|tara:strand:+ start:6590 stop:6823 length:234 start_codon:yes stop_codon:yes gene_type:complete